MMILPKYSTKTLTDVWDEASKFLEDYKNSPFYNAADCILSDANI